MNEWRGLLWVILQGPLPALGHLKRKERKEIEERECDTSQKLEPRSDHLPSNSQTLLPACPVMGPAERPRVGVRVHPGKKGREGVSTGVQAAEFRPERDLVISGVFVRTPPASPATDQLWVRAVTSLNLFPHLEMG